MTILGIFLNNTMRTGANRRYLELMESLAQRGNRVFMIMNKNLDYTPIYFIKIPLDIRYKKKRFPPASFLFKHAIKKHYAEIRTVINSEADGQIDWIHIHSDMHLNSALFLKKKTGARFFFAFRCNDITRAQILRKYHALTRKEAFVSPLFELLNRFREKKIAKNADMVTIQNSADLKYFQKRTKYPVSKTAVIPGNIGLPHFTSEWENKNSSETVKTILYIGNLSLDKGVQFFLKAIALLKTRGVTGIQAQILGSKDTDAPAFSIARKLGIEDIISFEGFADPFPYMAHSDILIYPSIYDAFPDAVLEALHTGCPVFASDIGGIPDILADRELLFKVGDVQVIADKISRCITDPTYYKNIRTLCAKRAAAYHFDWAQAFEQAMVNYE